MKPKIAAILISTLTAFLSFAQTTHISVDSPAKFISGSLFDFLQSNLVLPDSVKNGLSGGNLAAKLEIDSMGFVTGQEIVIGVKNCTQCSTEAIRLINQLPKPAFFPQITNNARVPSNLIVWIKFNMKEDSTAPYLETALNGKWTFTDKNYNKYHNSPVIEFNTDHSARLLNDKISWTLLNNVLTITDGGRVQRAKDFMSAGDYRVKFSGYLHHLELTGPNGTYTLTRD